ncbi:hypothetical protein F7734_28285 [Scytonema sp. UIC 10036]|uniref:hypothetical protein n=1 Tax=Scytonema sp. UIC 10036 TaxID=2304196 RepID=UPI0012DA1507|nr:hypothetical protein [Scytonema sp. UIC 10036]MUG96035.1 hypothetical protein [Scytonema sp. UIC 10036]
MGTSTNRPDQFAGKIVKINVDTGVSEQVTSGLVTPIAVKFNSKGELFALDIATGQILRINTITGQSEPIVRLQPGTDNLAFDSTDLLYVTNNIDSDITEVNTETGSIRKVVQSGGLTAPGGIAIYDNILYVADTFSFRFLDKETGHIRQTLRTFAMPLQYPLTVSVNDAHAIASSWFANTVQRLNRETGDVLNTYTGFGAPYDAIELSDGSILVADCALGHIVQILDETGVNRRIVTENLSCPTGLAQLDGSTVLVTESLGNKLSQIDVMTGERQVLAENLSSPEGVAYHPKGIAVVAEVGTQSVKAIDINTRKSITLKQNLPIGLPGFSSGPPPYNMTGVALADDVVYITGDLDNSIHTVKLDFKFFNDGNSSQPSMARGRTRY